MFTCGKCMHELRPYPALALFTSSPSPSAPIRVSAMSNGYDATETLLTGIERDARRGGGEEGRHNERGAWMQAGGGEK